LRRSGAVPAVLGLILVVLLAVLVIVLLLVVLLVLFAERLGLLLELVERVASLGRVDGELIKTQAIVSQG
jgi:hypothetical protein